jgi:trimethylamine:corrinoid methyltransferase-like protein
MAETRLESWPDGPELGLVAVAVDADDGSASIIISTRKTSALSWPVVLPVSALSGPGAAVAFPGVGEVVASVADAVVGVAAVSFERRAASVWLGPLPIAAMDMSSP